VSESLLRFRKASPRIRCPSLVTDKQEGSQNTRVCSEKATKLVPRMKNWSYEDRLAVMGLSSIHDRRVRGDLTQLFKLVNGKNDVSWVNPMVQSSSLSHFGPVNGIRGHKRRLPGQYSTKCAQRANFYTNRVVGEWNALPASVIESASVNQFKSRYYAFEAFTNMLPSTNPAYRPSS